MYSRGKRYILFSTLGFTTLASQIIILRQLMITFGGNELTLGAALASWMIWAGLANLIIGKFSDRMRRIDLIIPSAMIGLAVIFPATVIASELIKPITGIPTGEIAGLTTVLLSTIAILAPLCFIDGCLLNLLAKTGRTNRPADIGEVYLFDALGSAVGGIVYGWIAIEYLNPLLASIILSIILIAGIFVIVPRKLIPAAVMAAVIAIVFSILTPSISKRLIDINWRGYNPVKIADTKFQNIVVTENQGEYTMFTDGLPLFTIPDKIVNETLANLPMIETKDPKRILIIGGGISGPAEVINRYRPSDITYLQVDAEITKLETGLMGGKIPKNVNIVHQDGVYFVNNYNEEPFDVIIVNGGDPLNSAANRFFTYEFFSSAEKILSPDGVLSFGIAEPTNYVSKAVLTLLTTIFNTLKNTFSDIVVFPFDKYYFVSAKSSGIVTDRLDEIKERIIESGIPIDTFTSETVAGIDQERIDHIKTLINKNAKKGRINTDYEPVAYFYTLTLWAERLGAKTGRIFDYVSQIDYLWTAAFIIAAGLLSLIFSGRSSSIPVFWSLFAVGWTGITIELIILIRYEAVVGMLFYNIGFIITAFMIGLSVGAFFAIRFLKRAHNKKFILTSLMFVLMIYIPLSLIVTKLSFALANLITGLMCGIIYQIAAATIIKRGVGKAAGILNGADYIGAAAGSLFAAVISIPLFGFYKTILITAIVVFMAVVITVKYKWKVIT